jgi:hypothetical protein
VLNWTGQTHTFGTDNAGPLAYTGPNYTPDTVSIMIGINDLADGVAESQVRDDIGWMSPHIRPKSWQ